MDEDAALEAQEEAHEDDMEGLDGAAVEVTARKRKKRKKKKKFRAEGEGEGSAGVSEGSGGGGGGRSSSGGGSSDGSSDRGCGCTKQQDRRLRRALASVRGGEDAWVLLGGAGLGDADVEQLLEPLWGSASVTSLDLSGNRITAGGLRALAASLAGGGAPELISLDLRGNSLGPGADEALAALQRARKLLAVQSGPLPEPPPCGAGAGCGGRAGDAGGGGGSPGKKQGAARRAAGAEPLANGIRPAAADGGAPSVVAAAQQQQQQEQQQQQQQQQQEQEQQQQEQQQEHGGGAPAAGDGAQRHAPPGGDDFRASPMFRRFFVAGNSDAPDAQPNTDSDDDGDSGSPDAAPENIWARVHELLPGGPASIPALGAALRGAAGCLEGEVDAPLLPAGGCAACSSGSGSVEDEEEGEDIGGAGAAGGTGAAPGGPVAAAAAAAAAASQGAAADGSGASEAAGASREAPPSGGDAPLGTPSPAAATEAPPPAADTAPAAGGLSVVEALPGAVASRATGMTVDSAGADGLDGLRPHTRAAAREAALLRAVLGIEPRPAAVQFSAAPQPALGTHRLWAADVLALLLLAGQPAVDAAVAESDALPAALGLALSLDMASALHARALQMLHCATKSRVGALWRGLFEPGLGAGVAWRGPCRSGGGGGCGGKERPGARSCDAGDGGDGSATDGGAVSGGSSGGGGGDGDGDSRGGAGRGSSGTGCADMPVGGGGSGASKQCCGASPQPTLCPPLHEALAAIASESAGRPMGQRPGRTGFAAKAAQVLLAASGAWPQAPRLAPEGAPSSGSGIDAGGGCGGSSEGGGCGTAGDAGGDGGGDDGGGGGAGGVGGGVLSVAAPPPPAEGDAPNAAALAALLSASALWSAAAVSDGALASLLEEQQGELCGPRPARVEVASDDDADLGEALGAGGLITGEQLLAMLNLQ